MKLIKTANGNQIKLSKSEWESIGKTAGWITAEYEWKKDSDEFLKKIREKAECLYCSRKLTDENRAGESMACKTCGELINSPYSDVAYKINPSTRPEGLILTEEYVDNLLSETRERETHDQQIILDNVGITIKLRIGDEARSMSAEDIIKKIVSIYSETLGRGYSGRYYMHPQRQPELFQKLEEEVKAYLDGEIK